jgi:hypothetical protein
VSNDEGKIICQPNTTYSLSAYINNHSGCSVQLGIITYDQNGNVLATAGVGTSVASGATGRSSGAYTTPSNCYGFKPMVWITGTTGTGSPYFQVTCVQVELGNTVTNFVTGGTWYNLFTGLVEKWTPGWSEDGSTATVTVGLTDILAMFNRDTLYCAGAEQIISDDPNLYYPMWEPAGAANIGNIAFPDTTGARLVAATYPQRGVEPADGAGSGNCKLGVTKNWASIPGGWGDDQNTGLQIISGGNGGTQGYYVKFPVSGTLGTDALTIEVWFQTTATAGRLLSVGGQGVGHGGEIIDVYMTAGPTVNVVFADGQGNTATYTFTGVGDGNTHQLVVQIGANGTNVMACVDGQPPVTYASLPGTSTASWDYVAIGGFTGYYRTFVAIGAMYSHLAIWNQASGPAPDSFALTNQQIINHYSAMIGWADPTGYSPPTGINVPQRSDQRMASLVGWANYIGPTNFDVGTTNEGPATNLTNTSALSAMQQVQMDEDGVMFVQVDGTLRFMTRNTRLAAITDVVTFGEHVASGEIPYQADIEPSLDPTYLYNVDQISALENVDNYEGTPFSATTINVQSYDRYGPSTLTESLNLSNQDATILMRAYWKVSQYGTPQMRIPQIVIDAAGGSGAFTALLPIDIGTRVGVNRRPFGWTSTGIDCFIEGIQLDLTMPSSPDDLMTFTFTYDLSPAAYWDSLITNDPVYGVLNAWPAAY